MMNRTFYTIIRNGSKSGGVAFVYRTPTEHRDFYDFRRHLEFRTLVEKKNRNDGFPIFLCCQIMTFLQHDLQNRCRKFAYDYDLCVMPGDRISFVFIFFRT